MKTPQSLKSTRAPWSKAWYEIRRRGQQPPADGDQVVVVVTIHLPARKDAQLVDTITFNYRLSIAGTPLYQFWGYWDKKSRSRYATREFVAPTWAQAFAQAAAWAEAEIAKLEEALQARAKALQDAESVPSGGEA